MTIALVLLAPSPPALHAPPAPFDWRGNQFCVVCVGGCCFWLAEAAGCCSWLCVASYCTEGR
eukprot:SAG31_NODE_1965_length_6790_cov_70.718577_5_plen_62_part_00